MARQQRQGPFALGCKESFGGQTLLQLLKSGHQLADTLRLQLADHELVTPLWRVDAQESIGTYGTPVTRLEVE